MDNIDYNKIHEFVDKFLEEYKNCLQLTQRQKADLDCYLKANLRKFIRSMEYIKCEEENKK